MNHKKRDAPLMSMDEILELNNISYDTSTCSDYFTVVDGAVNTYIVDESFNLFDISVVDAYK